MSKKDMDRRKKFILELMGDPIYQPMRLREISSLLRLSKEEKRELYDVLDELCEEGKVSPVCPYFCCSLCCFCHFYMPLLYKIHLQYSPNNIFHLFHLRFFAKYPASQAVILWKLP